MAETKDVLADVVAALAEHDARTCACMWTGYERTSRCSIAMHSQGMFLLRGLVKRCREAETERDELRRIAGELDVLLGSGCNAAQPDEVRALIARLDEMTESRDQWKALELKSRGALRDMAQREEQAFNAGFLACQRAIYIPDSDCVRIDANADEEWAAYRASSDRRADHE